MKASCDSLLNSFCKHGLWIAALLLLCQCSLPPRQAWQYIRTHGLVTYMNYEARPSPPFGAAPGYSQRYVTRGSYQPPRYSQRPSSSWSSYRDAGGSYQYGPRSYPNRYYAVPTYPARSYEAPQRSAPQQPVRPRAGRPAPPPVARMQDEEEPAPPPRIVREEPSHPAPVAPKMSTTPPPAPAQSAATADLPYGTPVPGRPNMVNSPYAGKTQLVDISGMGIGQTVKCPYTGKLFKVPGSQQATNNAEPRLESKLDSPKMSSEPKGEDKKP